MEDGANICQWEFWGGDGQKFILEPFKEPEYIKGDVNSDDQFTVADLVMMQKFLLGNGSLTDWKAGDLCEDDRIDVFDMIMMRKLIIFRFLFYFERSFSMNSVFAKCVSAALTVSLLFQASSSFTATKTVIAAAQKSYLYGDMDGDEMLSVFDMVLLRKAAIDSSKLNDITKVISDLNADGKLEVEDLQLLQDYLLGKKVTFPAGIWYTPITILRLKNVIMRPKVLNVWQQHGKL